MNDPTDNRERNTKSHDKRTMKKSRAKEASEHYQEEARKALDAMLEAHTQKIVHQQERFNRDAYLIIVSAKNLRFAADANENPIVESRRNGRILLEILRNLEVDDPIFDEAEDEVEKLVEKLEVSERIGSGAIDDELRNRIRDVSLGIEQLTQIRMGTDLK